MTSPTPDRFLGPTPTPVTINNTGAWKDILQHEGIVSKDPNQPGDSQPHTSNDVLLVVDQRFWELQFSSERNLDYFGPLSTTGAGQNNAWIGDLLGCE
jgi:hypothetical protein